MRKYFVAFPQLTVSCVDAWLSRSGLRRALSIWVVTAMLNFCTLVAFASPKLESEAATGVATVAGVVKIDDVHAITGQTVFSGSSIVTAELSESTIYLGRKTRLTLYSESTLTLGFSDTNISGSMGNGSLRGLVPVDVTATIVTPNASIVTDPEKPAEFSVHASSGNTTIAVKTGRVKIRSGNKLTSINAGESFSTGHLPLSATPSQNLSDRKRIWLFVGIGGAIAVLIIAITGNREDEPRRDGCVIAPSGVTDGVPICP